MAVVSASAFSRNLLLHSFALRASFEKQKNLYYIYKTHYYKANFVTSHCKSQPTYLTFLVFMCDSKSVCLWVLLIKKWSKMVVTNFFMSLNSKKYMI